MAASPSVIEKPTPTSPCPCGSGQPFGVCCGPIIAGTVRPETAEQLMRARFTAHVTHDSHFLHLSYQGTAKVPFVPEEKEPDIGWTRLVIHVHELGGQPDTAFVDFSAHYLDNGHERALQEKAEFKRIGGEWIYTRPIRQGPAPIKAAQPKPGRNDPCPCGSGKKYKHCCLARA
jgi:SEC-C motif domain protein